MVLLSTENNYGAMDCETDALLHEFTILYCVSWADGNPVESGCWVLNWVRGNDYRDTEEFEEIQDFINTHFVGFHNAPFDVEVLRQFGFTIRARLH